MGQGGLVPALGSRTADMLTREEVAASHHEERKESAQGVVAWCLAYMTDGVRETVKRGSVT